MSNEDFNAEILAEKLSKLNNSQQSIESLSQWCVSHRKKAKQIVETWDNLFNSSQKEKRVSFLYLANDILQNSRRKGSEFVNEFWKVLPAALKHVYGNGDEHGKRVVTRLVNIWEERKVFGSRGHGLKDEMLGIIQKKDEALGKDPPPPSVSNGKSSNPIKIVKKDASSLRIKLVIGGLPEKILSAFQSVYEESSSEDAALEKCINAAKNMGKIEEEAQKSLIQGNLEGSVLVDGLQDQENVVIQCIHKLENAEATRASLVAQLKEALHDQESKLELIHAQLQVARGLVEQSNNLRIRLTSSSSIPGVPSNSTTIPISFSEIPILGEQSLPAIQPKTTPTIPGVPPNSTTIPTSFPEIPRLGDQSLPAVQPNTTPAPPPPLPQPTMTSFPSLKSSDGESKKAAVAAMAAKLAASTSSAQMLSSVLSSLVAEEAAASMNVGQKPSGFTAGLPIFPPEKKPKLEKPMAVSEVSTNSDISGPMYFTPQSMNNVPPPPSMAAQPNHMQAPFASPPPPPALAATVPALSSANPTTNQYVQPSGLMTMPYGYGSNSLPPPPPLPPQVALPLARPLLQPPQQPQHEQPQQQSGSGTGGYYRPPGIVFFGQSHQSTTSSVPRQ